jgi:hypothetical protein
MVNYPLGNTRKLVLLYIFNISFHDYSLRLFFLERVNMMGYALFAAPVYSGTADLRKSERNMLPTMG